MRLARVRQLALLALQRRHVLLATSRALTLASLRVRFLPFRSLRPHLGTEGKEASPVLTAAQAAYAREVSWALSAISRRLPRPPTCLAQAAAARSVLATRGVPATVYIGVASPPPGRVVDAHAWLRCGDRIVSGRAEARRYKPIVCFG